MWPYRKIVTQSLKTPLMIARIMFYLALLLVFPLLYGDGIHLTVAHKREWSYGFKPDNKTVPLPCYPESPYDHQRESSTS
ncbi:MAG: hypothetical protein DI541_14245 [Aeromonas media]|nr:MAG: hypothetical protein DI541_14245 [Aeromonas media]